MKKLLIALFVGSLATMAYAEKGEKTDKAEKAKAEKTTKEITTAGKVVCAKCDLDVVSKCQKAIKTRKGKAYLLTGEKVTEFFKADATKKAKRVKVTGKATGKEGEHVILTATKIEEAKGKAKKPAEEPSAGKAKTKTS